MENERSVDQRRERVRQFLREQAEILRRGGSVVATYRDRGGRRTGPYFRLAYRRAGRQRSLYLGADTRLADEVRAELGRLQAGGRQRRQLQRQRTILRREVRRHRAEWDRELRRFGLYLKGSEIRGWRNRHPPGAPGRP